MSNTIIPSHLQPFIANAATGALPTGEAIILAEGLLTAIRATGVEYAPTPTLWWNDPAAAAHHEQYQQQAAEGTCGYWLDN